MKKTLSIILIFSLLPLFCGGKGEEKVSLVAVGDNLIHTSIYKGASVGAGFDFSPVYAGVADIIAASDIAFVNQETMLGDSGYSGYPKFCSPVQTGEALVDTGFDVINIANNHSLDLGEAGFMFTREYLSGICECVIGDGEVRVVERNGMKIAFLSYTYATNYGMSACVSRFDENAARRDVKLAKEIADAVVVSMHWGVEYDTPKYVGVFEPTKTQVDQAHFLCSLGVDVIIGTHPHVIERAEWIEEGDRRTFCAYSLGNFVSNMRYGAEQLGAMLTLEFEKTGNGVRVVDPILTPIVCHYDKNHRGHTVYLLDDYRDELASAHGTQGEPNERRFTKKYLTDIYENNIDECFRPDIYKQGALRKE